MSLNYNSKDFSGLVVRPATVCGFSLRQRFDLVVNILTNLALNKKPITVFGAINWDPIYILDMIRIYLASLEIGSDLINGKVFNAGYHNHKVIELAELVKKVLAQILK